LSIPEDLLRIAKGEILPDSWTRQVYSVDASHYETTPIAVACPVDEGDLQMICEYGMLKRIPVTARGAGTGLLGQSLSHGISMDFTKHMNRILEIGEDYVVVQPGIVKSVLDNALRKKGKFLPPDPASSNYCTIGGMIANNSSGIHCLGYGNTIDFLEGVNVIYADGKAGFANACKYDIQMAKLRELLWPNSDQIRKGYPNVSKNSCGYRLDAVIQGAKFLPHKLFAASEGTLGIISSAKLRILDIPEYRCMMVLGFENMLEAMSAVSVILRFSPVALELLDHTITSPLDETSNANAGSLLFVEFAGNTIDIEQLLMCCRQALAGKCSLLEYASDDESMAKTWRARKSALNQVMRVTVGGRRPIGLIEDTVVHPSFLVNHASSLLRIYGKYKLNYVMYGHVGDGNLHTRPLINLDSENEVELITRIANRVFAKVIRNGGTITGEHGDGLARVGYIEMMYGKTLTKLFSRVKKLFDPYFILNPGKKVPI
jgi:glycolate oxidase